MRGTLKTSTLESKFPLLRVENNCIISKFADITAAYRVTLPELFTLTAEEYEALHGAWLKALKVLPDYTVVHKQDFFIEERYTAPEEGSERSFLARSYERHFNERPYLRHTCYLFVTKTTPEQMRQTSASSVLCRGFIVPREMRDTDAVTRFLEAAEQMERILNDSGLVRVERLTEAEIVGTADDLQNVSKTEVIKYAASGFRDFTRLAASDPTMWRDVCLHNKDAILEMLARFSEDLAYLQRAIRWGDGDKLFDLFTRTRAVRRSIIQAGQDTDMVDFGRHAMDKK